MVGFSGKDGRILSWNPAAEKLFGYTEAEAVGSSYNFLLPKNHPEEENGAYKLVMESQQPVHLETVRKGKSGAFLDVSMSAAKLQFDGQDIGVLAIFRDISSRRNIEKIFADQSRILSTLNRTGALLSAELDLEKLVQAVTDAGVELIGAQFGAFFYNVINEKNESYMLYTISGVPREAFSKFPMPQNTAIFHPTFHNEGPVRSDDITQDPRYGKSPTHSGMPKEHLPVKSYLAVSVVSRTGDVIGGLFFGHEEPARFTVNHEQLIIGVAAQAAIAIDNARLYQATQRELKERRQVQEALYNSEATFRGLADSMPQLVWTATPQGEYEYFNRRWCDYVGKSHAETKKEGRIPQFHPEDQPRAKDVWERSLETGEPYSIEYRMRRHDGVYRWYLGRALPMRDDKGNILRWFGTCTDIEDYKQTQQERQLLIRELNHRVKNLFAITSGMISMTARKSQSTKEMEENLKGRLGALARAHDLIRSAVLDEHQYNSTTRLNDLVTSIIAPHIDGREKQAVFAGPDVELSINSATSFALILHELATNAAKYGALLIPSGKLNITWDIKGDDLFFNWQETGVEIKSEPEKQGFGSQLAHMSVSGQLRGSINYDWQPQGVNIQIVVPHDRLKS